MKQLPDDESLTGGIQAMPQDILAAFRGICWVSSRKNRINVKVSVFPVKNAFSEVEEIMVASPY